MIAAVLLALGAQANSSKPRAPFVPPAIPLVAHDPYLSVWAMGEKPFENWSRHWTGGTQAICAMVRIDGRPWRLLGAAPSSAPPLPVPGVSVTPTRTTLAFSASEVEVSLSFLAPLLPEDVEVLSRPVTYVEFEARAIDGKTHEVSLYFDASAEWAVNRPDQQVLWERSKAGDLSLLRIGTAEQPVLGKAGDDLRIDWGWLYLGVPENGISAVAGDRACRDGFVLSGTLRREDDCRMPRPASDEWPVLACAFELGEVGPEPVSRHLLLAYDDLWSIELMGRRLRPYWRRGGMEADGLLVAAEKDHAPLRERCRRFDAEFRAEIGGTLLGELHPAAYRQCLAAHKIAAGEDGRPLMFPKENSSNGCISTVDVIYPAAPLFLLFNPSLLAAQLVPVLDYASSPRWRHPFAPHDLGTYPLANGQVYGGGEKTEENQMPVEESANMLLLLAALAKAEDDASLAQRYRPVLERWADYLEAKGLDPENQLSTDDFAGHLAHNANLSLKAILALGAWGQICQRMGKGDEAARWRGVAERMAKEWVAKADDGDHFRLAFDRPGTWSQKYNLVWDRLLDLRLFPPEVARKEIAFYRAKQNRFGLPLDGRAAYTKLDWLFWTAALAEDPRHYLELILPALEFARFTPDRVPLTDWYDTVTARRVGFQARSVVGGIFVRALADEALRKKWNARARGAAGR